ncbi:MAG: PAS domain-containing protein [Alphaproteobacteria bacterium]|nr:PAS domain-containing protein [Alphaproteobacteria bacterium]
MSVSTQVTPVDEEVTFSPDDIIVSKTDPTGRILYANKIFCDVAEMTTKDVIGQPHSIIRHPDMPRAIFKLLWDRIGAGHEIFAYVKNMSATGKYYWVLAHVTPSFGDGGKLLGYHSNRRVPPAKGLAVIKPLYQELLRIEGSYKNGKDALAASTAHLEKLLDEAGMDYDQFVWSLAA